MLFSNFRITASKNHYTRYLFMMSVLVLLTAGLIACSDSTDSGYNDVNGNDTNGEPASDEVWMEGMTFNPGNRTIDAGTTITWINNSNEVHTVTSGENGQHDGEFDSGNISPGEEFTHTFEEPGEYSYFCVPHVNQGMIGTITVE